MRPAGFEPATHSLEGCCSIQLSYGRYMVDNNNRISIVYRKRLLSQDLSQGFIRQRLIIDRKRLSGSFGRGWLADRVPCFEEGGELFRT